MFAKWKSKSYTLAQLRNNNKQTEVTAEKFLNYGGSSSKLPHGVTMEKTSKMKAKDEFPERRRGGLRGEIINLYAEIKKYEKNKEEEAIIKQAIDQNEFLKHIIKRDEIQQIIDAMSPLLVKATDTIIKQGQDAVYMYISQSGSYEIIIDDEPVETFKDSRVFGELAILYNNPRFATVKATTDCRMWRLDSDTYKQIIQRTQVVEEAEMVKFLKSIPLLDKASKQKLVTIANLLTVEFYKTTEEIVKQGDKGNSFYIIKSGTATVTVDGKGLVKTLMSGDYFGERALLGEDSRQATVTANKPGVECLVLSRLDFHNHLGDIATFLAQEDQLPRKSSFGVKKYQTSKLDDFEFMKTLGMGAYGRVHLAKHKTDDKKIFAIKVLKKHNIIKNNQQDLAYNEKNIQIICNSPFIVNLYKTFQDRRYIYYLMECCLGGDVFNLMKRQPNHCFDEASARFLAACILEGLTYLHERDIAYLDLKPENMLIDSKGYAKLSDFGNAIQLEDNQKTYLFAGTPEYIAPEIIHERGHNKMADYWAFGIFIFELLVGKTPFRTNDKTYMKTYMLILKGIDHITFPSKVSRNAESIVRKLCKSNKIRRLGCQKNAGAVIKKQKWFTNFNWEKLERQTMQSPFVPVLESGVDSKYFNKFRKDSDVPPPYEYWSGF